MSRATSGGSNKGVDSTAARMATLARESAFPFTRAAGTIEDGLSKREYYAAMAMQAIVSAEPSVDPAQAADRAVALADALLAKSLTGSKTQR